jgi:hypothetical protein
LTATGAVQPHITRQTPNLIPYNPLFDGTEGWYCRADNTVYDSNVSHDAGTGSYKMTVAYSDDSAKYSYVNAVVDYGISNLVPVTPGKVYTLSCYMRSNSYPSPLLRMSVKYYDANKNYIRPSYGSRQGNSKAGEWEEAIFLFRPTDGNTAYVEISFILMDIPENYSGTIWIDDIYLGEKIGFNESPALKKPFNGTRTRVDELGNVEILQDGVWETFFPISIYGGWDRSDWSFYSVAGFNTFAWAPDKATVQRAKDAGLMCNFDLSAYIVLRNDSRYNNLPLLESKIQAIKDAGLMNNILFFYCDNEISYREWDSAVNVTNKVRELDRDASGNLMHPIYSLQGNEGIARRYSSDTAVIYDIIGDYVTFDAPTTYQEENRGSLGLITLNNIQNQRAPTVMAQINNGVGMKFRGRVFGAIAHGAKGIGFWKDGGDLGPLENQPWWSDFPNIVSEIKQMMPLIREPHWTAWTVNCSSSLLEYGSRDHENRGYLIIANEQDTDITASFTVNGLPYSAVAVKDFFTGSVLAEVSNGQFTLTIPAYGSKVIELIPENVGDTTLDLNFNEDGGITAFDSSGNNNIGTCIGDTYLSGGSAIFDGSGDYINCGNNQTLDIGTSDVTLACRVKFTGTLPTYVGLITKGAGSISDIGYGLIYAASSDSLMFLISDGVNRGWYSTSTVHLQDGAWHEVVLTADRDGVATFYVDGNIVATRDISAFNGHDISNSGRDLLIGSWINDWLINGEIDNAAVYMRVLSTSELSAL